MKSVRACVPYGGCGGGKVENSNEGNHLTGERNARTPLFVPGIDYDPTNPLQARLAVRCLELARERERLFGEPCNAEAVFEVQVAVTSTPTGAFLNSLRRASRAWLEESLRSCDAFERDMVADAALD